jgi:ABC-type uncharacterized transport system fused permease/ATPase subunit
MQDMAAFAATASAIAWFALSYRDLFQLSARVQRLSVMNAAMDQPPPAGIEVASPHRIRAGQRPRSAPGRARAASMLTMLSAVVRAR